MVKVSAAQTPDKSTWPAAEASVGGNAHPRSSWRLLNVTGTADWEQICSSSDPGSLFPALFMFAHFLFSDLVTAYGLVTHQLDCANGTSA